MAILSLHGIYECAVPNIFSHNFLYSFLYPRFSCPYERRPDFASPPKIRVTTRAFSNSFPLSFPSSIYLSIYLSVYLFLHVSITQHLAHRARGINFRHSPHKVSIHQPPPLSPTTTSIPSHHINHSIILSFPSLRGSTPLVLLVIVIITITQLPLHFVLL